MPDLTPTQKASQDFAEFAFRDPLSRKQLDQLLHNMERPPVQDTFDWLDLTRVTPPAVGRAESPAQPSEDD